MCSSQWPGFISVAPDNVPNLLTCHTIVTSLGGDKKRTNGSACEDLTDFYGNFLASYITVAIGAEFTVDITSSTKPQFINESNFGVTDVTVELWKQHISSTAAGKIWA